MSAPSCGRTPEQSTANEPDERVVLVQGDENATVGAPANLGRVAKEFLAQYRIGKGDQVFPVLLSMFGDTHFRSFAIWGLAP